VSVVVDVLIVSPSVSGPSSQTAAALAGSI
jgi:hypothetical protein